MRRLRDIGLTVAIVVALMGMALTAQAFDCTDSGVGGWLNGTTADDAGCITEEEYKAIFSVGNLADIGVLISPVDNGNGTVTGTINGGTVTLEADPLDRPVAANPTETSPTVREVLFPFEAGFSLLPA